MIVPILKQGYDLFYEKLKDIKYQLFYMKQSKKSQLIFLKVSLFKSSKNSVILTFLTQIRKNYLIFRIQLLQPFSIMD